MRFHRDDIDSLNQVCGLDIYQKPPSVRGLQFCPGVLQFLARFIPSFDVSILVSNIALPYILAWINYGTLSLGSVANVMSEPLLNGAGIGSVPLPCPVKKKPI